MAAEKISGFETWKRRESVKKLRTLRKIKPGASKVSSKLHKIPPGGPDSDPGAPFPAELSNGGQKTFPWSLRGLGAGWSSEKVPPLSTAVPP